MKKLVLINILLSLYFIFITPSYAQDVPDLQTLFSANPVVNPSNNRFSTPGLAISQFYSVIFYIAIALAFIWLSWGAFQYIFAGGDEESLESARSRIIWAIIGLFVIAISYLIVQWVGQILQPDFNTIPI